MGAFDAFLRDRDLVDDAVDTLKSIMIDNLRCARTGQINAMGGMECVLMAMDNRPDGGLGVRYNAVFVLRQMSLAGQVAQQRLAALGVEAPRMGPPTCIIMPPNMGRYSSTSSPRSTLLHIY